MKFLVLLIIVIGIYSLIKYFKKTSISSNYNKSYTDDLIDSIPIANLPGPGLYTLDIVGESHYQESLETICGRRKEDGEENLVEATLILEDNNPHDNQAVRVDIEGKTVGYLSRENARAYRQELNKAGYPDVNATCCAKIIGGWDRGDDKGYYGVKLDLPTDETSSKKYVYSDGDSQVTVTVNSWDPSPTSKIVGDDLRKTRPNIDRNKEIDRTIKKTQAVEKEDQDTAIANYKKAIEDIIVLENEGSLPKAWVDVSVPINRLTLLLERKKDYVECIKYLNWYDSFDDRSGISSKDSDALKKRRDRVEKKLSKK